MGEGIDYVVDGRTYTFVNDLSTTYSMSIGTSFLVEYNPDDYSDAIIGSDSTSFIVFGIEGLLLLLFLCFFILKLIEMEMNFLINILFNVEVLYEYKGKS